MGARRSSLISLIVQLDRMTRQANARRGRSRGGTHDRANAAKWRQIAALISTAYAVLQRAKNMWMDFSQRLGPDFLEFEMLVKRWRTLNTQERRRLAELARKGFGLD